MISSDHPINILCCCVLSSRSNYMLNFVSSISCLSEVLIFSPSYKKFYIFQLLSEHSRARYLKGYSACLGAADQLVSVILDGNLTTKYLNFGSSGGADVSSSVKGVDSCKHFSLEQLSTCLNVIHLQLRSKVSTMD